MQLEQQETFEIKSPQLEVFGQVESKLPAPAKKRPFAAGFLAVMVLVSVFGIGGVQLKSRYRNVAEIYHPDGYRCQPDACLPEGTGRS